MRGPVLQLKFPMLVVRHGQTDGNVRHVLHGQVDEAENQLNKTGRAQAREAAVLSFQELENRMGYENLIRLAKTAKLLILTSPITRARETADFFIQHFQHKTGISLKAQMEEDLKEIDFGKYDGYSLEEIEEEEFTKLVIQYRTVQDARVNWHGTGESFLDVVKRAKRFLEKLNQKCKGKIVVAFSHGTVISGLRTVVGDRTLLGEDGMIAFRDNVLEHAKPYWLGEFQSLIRLSL